MTVAQLFEKTKLVRIPDQPLPVEETCAAELKEHLHVPVAEKHPGSRKPERGVFHLAVAGNADFDLSKIQNGAPQGTHWAFIRFDPGGGGELIVSHPALLYGYTRKLVEDWIGRDAAGFLQGKYFQTAFRWHRPLYDYLLTQTWRTARNFDPEAHIRELARAGYTHLEVNGLAMPVPLEQAVPGEFYSQFYAYCLALDQYVSSALNEGIYPREYLSANLALLRRYAAIGRKYGLEPGILCFEPRSVPERLLQKFPTLRGARVDHPFRSRQPRYNLTIAHPAVQAHYREMMQKLLRAVPDLAYMSIWSNDSGAGFEYTSSLYVGRNGGPYLIREWRTHEQIAEVAGKNIVHFMQILHDAAAEINPTFRVTLRLEPFKVEHDVIMQHLQPGLDIEVPSLLVRGYDLPYHHDKYEDVTGVAGSVQHLQLEPEEHDYLEALKQIGLEAHLIYTHGNGYNFEPLLGIPFPCMLWQKLQAMRARGVQFAANLGGHTPAHLAPYHINQEIFRAFMLDAESQVDEIIRQKAVEWAGEAAADPLIELWQKAEEAIRWLPPLPLYSHFGFVWLRTWVRPIVPDLHAIPREERRYYEDFMVSSANNTNLVDLGRDVLFDLVTPAYGEKYVARVDANVFGRLDGAIALADRAAQREDFTEQAKSVFADQRDRLQALRCWIGSQRSVAAWVVGVHGYLNAANAPEKSKWRQYLEEMMAQEIAFTRDLLKLWQTSRVHFMVVSGSGETSYMYGENFGELLQRKIELMQKYRHVEPRIDADIIWKL